MIYSSLLWPFTHYQEFAKKNPLNYQTKALLLFNDALGKQVEELMLQIISHHYQVNTKAFARAAN